ncbi:hypothetical protein Tco_1562327 [Tanacetum coccineum]
MVLTEKPTHPLGDRKTDRTRGAVVMALTASWRRDGVDGGAMLMVARLGDGEGVDGGGGSGGVVVFGGDEGGLGVVVAAGISNGKRRPPKNLEAPEKLGRKI